MAISWLTALKVIPWTDVVAHAPQVLKTARDLMRKPPEAAPAVTPASSDPHTARLEWLERQLSQQRQHQQAMAQTLADLAEDHARLVATVDGLRRRNRWMALALLALGAALLGHGLMS